MEFTEEQKKKAEALFAERAGTYCDMTATWMAGGVRVAQMYEYINVNFALLSGLADIFGTKNIDTDQVSSQGCETCDYGSSYEVTFYIKPDEAKS